MLEYKDYKDRLKEIYPLASDELLERTFLQLIKFWESMIDNYELIKNKDNK